MRKAICLALAVSVVGVTSAPTKTRDKSWEFGAYGSHLDGDPGIPVHNGYGAGISVGYNFSAKVAAELLVSRINSGHGDLPDLAAQASGSAPSSPASGWSFSSALDLRPHSDDSSEMLRAFVQVTATFLADREVRTTPYISAGLGVVNETRAGFPYDVDYLFTNPDVAEVPNAPRTCKEQLDMNGQLSKNCTIPARRETLEEFDSSAILTLAVGGRSFFTDSFGVRYEVRYNHHDSFELSQDEFQVHAGITWVVGGQK